jgi:type IV secretory pathway VirB10-like protein
LGRKARFSTIDGTGSPDATVLLQVGVAVVCVSIVWLAWMATSPAQAAPAQPQPDPAPTASPIAPDPAPGTSPVAPAPQEPATSAPPVPSPSPAPTPAEPQFTPEPTPAPRPAPDAARPKRPDARKRAGGQRTERRARPTPARAEARSLAPVGSLIPSSEPADDSHHLFLLAAGALLALLMASGSLISVASRATRGHLR